MVDFHIDPAKRRKISTVWIVVTLSSLHVWATLIVAAALLKQNPNTELLSAMFSTVTTGIGAVIFILLVDKGADFVIDRFGIRSQNTPLSVTETVTRTVETQPDTGAL